MMREALFLYEKAGLKSLPPLRLRVSAVIFTSNHGDAEVQSY